MRGLIARRVYGGSTFLPQRDFFGGVAPGKAFNPPCMFGPATERDRPKRIRTRFCLQLILRPSFFATLVRRRAFLRARLAAKCAAAGVLPPRARAQRQAGLPEAALFLPGSEVVAEAKAVWRAMKCLRR